MSRQRTPDANSTSTFFRNIEPTLQHNGFAITFLFTYFLVNAVFTLRGAGVGWVLGRPGIDSYPWFDVLARAGGAILNLNSAFVILVAAKATRTYLRSTALNMFVPFDKAMPAFHSLIGNVLVIGTILHVAFQACNYVAFDLWNNNPPDRIGLTSFRSLLLTGGVLLVIIGSMRITSLPIIRRKKWELFWGNHLLGFFLYYVVLMMHGFHDKVPMTWRYTTGPLVLYVLDRCYRFQCEKGSTQVISRSCITQKGDDMTCLRIPRGFPYVAGQYCEIKIPRISTFQWHPFTIASAPHESDMLFFIKKNGDWTSELYDLAGQETPFGNFDNEAEIMIQLRGPYGAPAQHTSQYEHVVLISGGVGATPFASITKHIHHWIVNYTARGQTAVRNHSVAAQFSRNQSTHTGTPRARSANISRSTSRRISSSYSRSHSRPISHSSSGSEGSYVAFSRNTTDGTMDSVSQVIHNQRSYQPYRPTPRDNASDRPHDYVMDLGDPNAPIPDRNNNDDPNATPEGFTPQGRPMMEVVREYDSSRSLFSDDYEDPREVQARGGMVAISSQSPHFREENEVMEFVDDEFDAELGGRALEDEIIREQQTASNAYGMLGMSMGSNALLKHLQMVKDQGIRQSQIRASMNVLDEVFEKAPFSDQMLFFLHTVTINWCLIWLMIIRFALVGIGGIVGNLILDYGHPLTIYNSHGFAACDIILSTMILIPCLTAIVIEVYTLGIRDYIADQLGNVFDLVLLVPLLVSSIVFPFFLAFYHDVKMPYMFEISVYILWPITTVLLLWRTGRTIGSRIALAGHWAASNSHSETKSVDFIWTSKVAKDDHWLIDELLPFAGRGIVRLHRFITREEARTEPWMLNYEKVPLKTKYKRPDWDEIFLGLVERSRSGTCLGVFFCGPDGMAKAIQQASMKAMAVSVENARIRGYNSKLANPSSTSSSSGSSSSSSGDPDDYYPGSDYESQLKRSRSTPPTAATGPGAYGVISRVKSNAAQLVRSISTRKPTRSKSEHSSRSASEKADKSEYGCNVRIAVRVENFN